MERTNLFSPASPFGLCRGRVSALHFVANEDWSGRGDLNAPEAHKPLWGLLFTRLWRVSAFGGPGPGFGLQFIKPLSALAGFEKFFSVPCQFIIWKILSMYHMKFPQKPAMLIFWGTLFPDTSRKIIGYSNISLPGISL
jgi:hypothetical protein